ncbi:hypothetical protein CYMTET_42568 [Cymbomonas tetramitiformis]|uniref:Uncharacterized protein n=1 Tax=Cymbomonas tetramitiformis TaxID=36881 RepID=A0AAE0C401_9CHLO|nr:hypothetical protein CYMTET_42568 [Cymbomonas tetramitiformis]
MLSAFRSRGAASLVEAGKSLAGALHCNHIAASGVAAQRAFQTTSFKNSGGAITKADIEHATGLELAEMEAALEGYDLFGEDQAWLNAPTGTEENPVVVTSMFTERIVGASDPDDDSHVIWSVVKEGAAPKLIGGEYFILKQVGEPPHH